MPSTPREPLPPLGPIVDRLLAQLGSTPGSGRLTREDVLVLAALAVEREATKDWTVHRAGCTAGDRNVIAYQRRCTCGLEAAEERSLALRLRLRPLDPPPDPRQRGRRDPR